MKEYLISGFKLDAFRLINARIIVEYKKIYSNKNTICLLIGLLLKKRPVILNMPKKLESIQWPSLNLLVESLKAMADEGILFPTGLNEYEPVEDAAMMQDHLVGSYLMRIIQKSQNLRN